MSEEFKTLHLVIGKSESGDEYYSVHEHKPTKKVLKDLAFSWDGDTEDPSGCGYAGSNVHVEVFTLHLKY